MVAQGDAGLGSCIGFGTMRDISFNPQGSEAGAKEVAEELGIAGQMGRKRPSGAKARACFAGFMRGLKPPPPSDETESASLLSFSAACKAQR